MYPSPNPLPYFVRKGAIRLNINVFPPPCDSREGDKGGGYVCVGEVDQEGKTIFEIATSTSAWVIS